MFVSPGSDTPEYSVGLRLGVASFFWLAGGFAPTLLAIIVPWFLAVSVYQKLRWSGRIYFPVVGAFMVFVLGCAIASLMPKPLFIEDQTFLEGAVVVAQREGICLLLAGIAFGASYWFFGERRIPAEKQDSVRRQ